MEVINHWPEIKRVFNSGFKSSLHHSIASVNDNGEPHVTPIGSLILGKPGHGFYFEKFTTHLPKNLQINREVCILAVNSSKWLWIKSLIQGGFKHPPALRLFGTVGQIRKATSMEIKLFQRRVKPLKFTKGHAIMWSNLSMVRDIEFSRIEPVRIGKMTQQTWTHNLSGQSI